MEARLQEEKRNAEAAAAKMREERTQQATQREGLKRQGTSPYMENLVWIVALPLLLCHASHAVPAAVTVGVAKARDLVLPPHKARGAGHSVHACQAAARATGAVGS